MTAREVSIEEMERQRAQRKVMQAQLNRDRAMADRQARAVVVAEAACARMRDQMPLLASQWRPEDMDEFRRRDSNPMVFNVIKGLNL